MKRRVGMVLNAVGLGGVTEVVYQLCAHLAGGSYEPALFFLKPSDREDRSREQQARRFADLGIDVATASGRGGKVGAIADLTAWGGEQRIDLIHTHSYRPNLYGRMAGAILRPDGLRLIAHYHNHYDDKWAANSADLTLERALARSTDALIAVSSEVRDHVAGALGLSGAQFDVIENGVDPHRFQPSDRDAARQRLGLESEAFIVGVVGRICEQKGQDDLVEAVLGEADLGAARIVFFGDIEDRDLERRLKARIAAAGRGHMFNFFGHLGEVPLAFAACDVVATPSRWEGCPLVIAEAMACARPIVATAVSAIPSMVGHGEAGILVPARDPQRLAAALLQLMRQPDLRRTLGANGLARSAAYSWDATARAVASVYGRVLDSEDNSQRCA